MRKTLLLSLLACGAMSQATILTFDMTEQGNVTLDVDYGDNVNAAVMGDFMYDISNGVTPDVTVDYFGNNAITPAMTRWTTGYSDLNNVIEYEPDGETGYNVVISGNGAEVSLHGFDMGNFGATVIVPGVTVVDESNNVLFSQTNFAFGSSNDPHMSFDFANALVGQTLTIKIDTTGLGGFSDNIGLDNISFTQSAVPEPMTMAVLAGAAILAWRRRRS